MENKQIDVIGFGSPLLDLLVEVEDFFLEELELKKGEMHITSEERALEILEKLNGHNIDECAGGSCANTIYGIAYLGGKSAFCGVVGDDEHGKTYDLSFNHKNNKNILHKINKKTGHAITFITNDSQRTFATHLGAAIEFKKHHVLEEDIIKAKILHVEAYQIEGEETKEAMIEAMNFAKKHNIKISLDLSDPALIKRQKKYLEEIVEKYIDIIFANEEEAKEYTGLEEKDALNFFGNLCEIAIVKLGAKGSLIKTQNKIFEIPAEKIIVKDTTGAGDMFAAGFLYGITNNKSIEEAGKIATENAAKVVSQIGARLK
ncbi:MAG: adenosine kinase [Nanoarchaeota archaeon]|nr:adenosine kinase [Nanoarchaeota archaeon]